MRRIPALALTAAALATTNLKVGALVFDNDYKHPVVLAKELATMDLLSDGRLVIGTLDYRLFDVSSATPQEVERGANELLTRPAWRVLKMQQGLQCRCTEDVHIREDRAPTAWACGASRFIIVGYQIADMQEPENHG